jgi:hypothetical protein
MDPYNNLNGNDALFELLDQMGGTDPRLQILTKFLRSRNSLQADSVHVEERAPAKVASLMTRYEQLKQKNVAVMQRNDVLASALGACSSCWGENSECETCGGEGSPGTYVPDKETFITYVLPAVRKVRLIRKTQNSRTDSAAETKANLDSR